MYPQCDNYPDQRSQMPYPHHYPSFSIPPQMSVNPVSHSPAAYGPWSYGGNYGYRIPDSHNYFSPYHCSGYPHPYLPPPPLPYFHDACCPSFSKIHHPYHYAPPPNYSMELPIYDYDKKPHWRCPYHPCSLGGDTVEKETDAEKKTDSLPSAQSKNLPYPIVLIRPEEMSTAKKMHGGFAEPEPNTRNHDESMNSSNQPCDPIKLEKGGKVENQFPFPIIWVPYKQEEAGKKDHAEGKTTPTNFMRTGHEEGIPFKETVDSNVDQATAIVRKNDLSRCKSIPVKQLDEMVDNNNIISKEAEKELAKNNPEGGSSTKRQTSPLSKTCKLPPVCLRVEPFPKRKNGSGKSRSLSPPKKGRHEEESFAKTELKEENKLVQVSDEHTDPKTKEDGNSEAMDSKEVSVENVKRKRSLTEVEAAVLIQAAYRGYEVRKWDPIKKLKAIGKVREELDGVKSRIKASSSSSSSSSEEKERSLIGEMIMNLLLKLDTIQGLDPVARDMRKLTAKELVKLQEEVDCVVEKGEDVNNLKELVKLQEEVDCVMEKGEDVNNLKELVKLQEEVDCVVEKGEDVNNSKELVKLEEEMDCVVEKGEDVNNDSKELVKLEEEVDCDVEKGEDVNNDSKEHVNIEEEVDCVVKKGEDVKNSLEMESSAATKEMKQHDDEEEKEEEVNVCEGGDVEANKKEEEEEVKVCEGGDVEANKKEEEEEEGSGEDSNSSSLFELKEEKGVDMKMDDEMMEKMVEKGKEQLEVIRELSERVKILEKKLAATASKNRKGGGRSKTRTRR